MSLSDSTLNEHAEKYPATGSRGKFHNIRVNARKVMKDANINYACKVCGYTNYVEVCHIKAIADFTGTSFIKEVNALDNLVYLCPNHHWELDNDLLKLDSTTDNIIPTKTSDADVYGGY